MKDYLKDAIPTLPCRDVSEAIKYYETSLGFDKSWMHEDLYGAAFNGNVEIHFFKAEKEFTPYYIYMLTGDVDKLHEFIKSGNVNIEAAPHDTFYGMRECIIRDLNGHRITFANQITGRESNVPKEI